MMDSLANDRNLLTGIVALQLGFVSRDALIPALVAWSNGPTRPVGQVLLERRLIAPEDLPVIVSVVDRLLAHHAGSPAQCLDSLGFEVVESLQQAIRTAPDSMLLSSRTRQAESDGKIGPNRDATTAWAPATGPADGHRNGQAGAEAGARTNTGGAEADSTRIVPPGCRFRYLRDHASGGLGVINVAWDEELGREVALKEIRREHVAKPRARGRFLREAEINANLEHPGIVPVYGLGTYADGRPYYAMRLVHGESLQDALERLRHRTANPAEWLNELRPLVRNLIVVCDAIEYAHSRNVLHRDLKPPNILLGKYGETLIIDWGLAKVRDRGDDVDLADSDAAASGAGAPGSWTAASVAEDPLVLHHSAIDPLTTVAGETLGSPPFMSPEQAASRHHELTPATDVYSLGATLYAMLAGQPPVRGRTRHEIQAKVIAGDIPPVRQVNPIVPQPLEEICRKAMALRPEDRYPSARALANDLERWLDDRPVSVVRDPVSTRLLRWARHHKAIAGGSLGLLAATIVGLIVFNIVIGAEKQAALDAQAQAELARRDSEAARQVAASSAEVGLEVVDQLVTLGDRQLISAIPTSQRQAFLTRANAFLGRFQEFAPDNPVALKRTAVVARRLANLYRVTGEYEQAEPFYERDLATTAGLHRSAPHNTEFRDLYAEALLEHAEALLRNGKVHLAEIDAGKAEMLAQVNRQAESTNPRFRRTSGRVANLLGDLAMTRGITPAEAAVIYRKAVEEQKPLADSGLNRIAADVNNGRFLTFYDQYYLMDSLMGLARAERLDGHADRAESTLLVAMERSDQVATILDNRPIPDLILQRSRLGIELGGRRIDDGRAAEAKPLLDDAIARLKRIESTQSASLGYREAVAEARIARGRARLKTDDTDGADNDLREARKSLEPLIQRLPNLPGPHLLLANVHELTAQIRPSEAGELRELARRERETASQAEARNQHQPDPNPDPDANP